MTKIHSDQLSLSGKQRNYRTPGAKLKPRDAFDAHRAAYRGCSAQQLRKDDAIEAKVMGYPDPQHMTYAERRVERLKRQVSTRAYKRLLDLVNGAVSHAPSGNCALFVHGAARQRLINAMLEHVRVEHAIEWDRKLHRYAA